MWRERAGLYAPFLALVAVQALLVVTLPSRADVRGGASAGAYSANALPNAGPGRVAGRAAGSSAPDGGTLPGGAVAAPGSSAAAEAAVESACASPATAADQQLGTFCNPVFKGENGGTTAQGVTKDTIEIVWFEGEPDAVVDGVLSQKGMASTEQQRDAAIASFTEWANTHWELYGRKIHVTRFIGKCPIVQEDHDTCLASAQEVVALKPFAVIYVMLFYADVFDVWANAGIPSFGGLWWDSSYYAPRRPYRWDYFSNGTEIMDYAAEYYCKNMFGGRADHAGVLIHPTIGGRETPRHLAIVTRDERELGLNAEHLRDQVAACTGGKDVPTLVATGSDGSSTQTTMTALTAKLINDKVTTVICQCEAVGSSIVSAYFSKENYFPEWLIAPMGGMDSDTSGQLADQQQWAHVVGLGQLWDAGAIDSTPASQVWHKTGHDGLACGKTDCGAIFTYIALLGMGIEHAGPNLNPLTLEKGMFAARDLTPKDAYTGHFNLGPNDYNFLSDVRAIYWDPTAKSRSNGDTGAYVAINGGQRYSLGGLPTDLVAKTPVSAS